MLSGEDVKLRRNVTCVCPRESVTSAVALPKRDPKLNTIITPTACNRRSNSNQAAYVRAVTNVENAPRTATLSGGHEPSASKVATRGALQKL